MQERRKGTYAACGFSSSTKECVREWMSSSRIPRPINVENLHSTIIYSRNPIPPECHRNMSEKALINLGWKFKIEKFDWFENKPGGDTYALVGVLSAPELIKLHAELISEGATHDFPEYHPHVTFSYSITESFDISSLKIPDFYFVPAEIYFEALDLNWEDK